jgi:membrane fusion protein (multidrug efflux system)
LAEAKLAAYNAKIDEARSAEASAAAQLSYTLVRAPFDGFIDRIPLKAGTYISEGNLLTTVSDNSEVYAYFNVSETEYLEYSRSRETRSDQMVHLILADGTPFAGTGKIETLESEFEENTGSIAFRARFPNPKQLLKHGASGKVVLTNQLEDALLLPQKAVFEMQDKNYVYILDSANQVKMKSFASYARIKHSYIVQEGLKPGEKVVYEGVRSLREGMRIKPQMLSLDTLSAL